MKETGLFTPITIAIARIFCFLFGHTPGAVYDDGNKVIVKCFGCGKREEMKR